MDFFQHCYSICHLSDSIVSEDAGIVPRTNATLALAVRLSNHLARSHPHSARSHHTRLYLIHNRLYLIHTRPVPRPELRRNYWVRLQSGELACCRTGTPGRPGRPRSPFWINHEWIFLSFWMYFLTLATASAASQIALGQRMLGCNLTLAARRSNHSNRFQRHSAKSHLHQKSARSHPHSAKSHPLLPSLIHTWLGLIHTRLYLIHPHSSRSHPHSARFIRLMICTSGSS